VHGIANAHGQFRIEQHTLPVGRVALLLGQLKQLIARIEHVRLAAKFVSRIYRRKISHFALGLVLFF